MTFARTNRACETCTEKKKHPVRNGMLATIAAFAAYIAYIVVIQLLIGPFLGEWSDDVSMIAFRLPTAVLVSKLAAPRKPAAGPRAIPKKTFRKFAVLYAVACILPVHLALPNISATGDPVSDVTFATNLIASLFLAPVVEEIIFRGALFGISRRFMGFWPSALANAACFSLIHFSRPVIMLTTIPFSLMCCFLRETTGKTAYGIALHFMFNWLGIILVFVAGLIPPFVTLPVLAASLAFQAVLLSRKEKLAASLLQD